MRGRQIKYKTNKLPLFFVVKCYEFFNFEHLINMLKLYMSSVIQYEINMNYFYPMLPYKINFSLCAKILHPKYIT